MSLDLSYPGYSQYGMAPMMFLLNRFNQTELLHRARIAETERMLRLWAGIESEVYGTRPKSDQEERLKISKPWKIVDLMTALVWSRDPEVSVAPSMSGMQAARQSTQLSKAIAVLMAQHNLWEPFGAAAWWSVVAGAGPVQYWFDPLSLDDDSPLVVQALDPRTCVWKETLKKDGSLQYVFIAKDEYAMDILRKWNVETLGDPAMDQRAKSDPGYKIRVYDYWCEERAMNPATGKPMRHIVNAVFMDNGKWLRQPEVMVGYSRVPVHIFKGSNYPVEHTDPHLAYASALLPIEDEIRAEAHLASYILKHAKDQVAQTFNLTTNRTDANGRVSNRRGGLNRLYADEKLEPMNKGTTVSQDVQFVSQKLADNIQGATLPQSFDGSMKLDDVSGISLSLAATGPLVKIAKRQKNFEDGLQTLLPAMITCIGRHAMTLGRNLSISGPDPKNTQQFFATVIDPMMLVQADMRVSVKLSSSLPRDAINLATVVQGLMREGKLSDYTGLKKIFELIDFGVTDPDDERVRRVQEQREAVALQAEMQQYQMQTQMGMQQQQQQPATDNENFGSQSVARMGTAPTDNRGPWSGTPQTETNPNSRGIPRAVADTSMRGQGPTSNPLELRRRASDFIGRTGALTWPPQARRNT